jgi:acyl carrier protein
MGLDVVELVLECEKEFDVKLEDWRLGQMRTVGDLFELICEQLQLPWGPDVPRPVGRTLIPRLSMPKEGWDRETVWTKLVQIVTDQLQVDSNEVKYFASFSDDLKAD